MSLDLYAAENTERLANLRPVQTPDPEAFDGFIKGTAIATMKGFARAGSAIDLAGAPLAMGQDLLMGSGTEAQDRYFKEHDEAFGSAADHWTPRPGEVGTAADVVGGLLSTLPLVIAAPELAVASAHLGAAEELIRQGISPEKANLVGAVQGVGLGLGIWMPVLGANGWQRILAGGAGFNLAQGVVTRGAAGAILQGTPAAEDFKAFDGKTMTLDALLGLAFGSLAHLVPSQRAQSERAWIRIRDWAQNLNPSDVDAIAVLRQAEHKNVDSAPGKLTEPQDIEAHVQRVDTALEQLARGEEVAVEDRPAPNAEPDPQRWKAAERGAEQLQKEAEALGKAYDLVLEQPVGPVNEPTVRLTPREIGDVLVERGMGKVSEKDGEISIRKPRFGLLKIIWKHGERSNEPEDSRVQKEDVVRTPEVLRDYKPIVDEVQPDGKRLLEWQVERADGKRVIYSVRRFSEADGEHHLVTIFVNKMDQPRFKDKPLSEKANRPSESPTVGSMPSVRDTGQQPLVSSAGGQKGGSEDIVGTEGPAGQPSAAEPPPPPRGEQTGKPAGLEAKDPLIAEAQAIAAERPDLPIRTGEGAAGEPVIATAKEFMAAAADDAGKIREQAKLMAIAAQCMLGML